MHIDIQSRGFALTPALRSHVDRKLRLALGATRPEVLRISVRLGDDNGPRGGSDMHCRVRVSLAGAPDIVIEDRETDLYVAVDRAADRAGRTLVRRLTRRNERRFAGQPEWDEAGGFIPVRARRVVNEFSDERI